METALQISHAELEGVLETANVVGQSVFIKGAPGIGKSQSVRNMAEARAACSRRGFVDWNRAAPERKKSMADGEGVEGLHIFVDIRLGDKELGEMRIPDIHGHGGAISWRYLDALTALSHENVEGTLFLDEFNQAPRSVLGACYGIVLDRCFSSLVFGDGVAVVAAGNRHVDKCGVTPLQTALINRMLVVELAAPRMEEWRLWAAEAGVRPDILGFLSQFPKYLNMDAGKRPVNPDSPFPTPRAWEQLSRLMDAAGRRTGAGLDERTAFILASGKVGDGIACEFATFTRMAGTFDVRAMLDSPETFKTLGFSREGRDLSIRWAAICAVADYVAQDEERKSKEVFRKAILLIPHIEEGELALELARLLKDVVKQAEFISRVMSLAQAFPPGTPSSRVPEDKRMEFEARERLIRWADIISRADFAA